MKALGENKKTEAEVQIASRVLLVQPDNGRFSDVGPV
jgi:hypothetical protein